MQFLHCFHLFSHMALTFKRNGQCKLSFNFTEQCGSDFNNQKLNVMFLVRVRL
jgi:hypothetical protein